MPGSGNGGDALARTSGRRPAHGPTRTLRGARGMGGRVGQPAKRLSKKRAPPPCRRRSRLRHDGATGWSTGAGLRRYERTVMGVENARMAGRCPVQVEHERGRRHDGMDDVPSGSTFGWSDPGGFVPLTGPRVVRPHPLAVAHAAHHGFTGLTMIRPRPRPIGYPPRGTASLPCWTRGQRVPVIGSAFLSVFFPPAATTTIRRTPARRSRRR